MGDQMGKCARIGIVLLAASLGAHHVRAEDETQTVYRVVDEHGVVSFSDQAMPNAEAIELSVSSPTPESLDETNRRLEADLEWLTYLEETRRNAAQRDHQEELNALELARARAELERARQPEMDEYPYETYPYGFWPVHRPRPPVPGRPDPPFARPPFAPPTFAPPAFGQNQPSGPLEPPPPVTSSPLPIRR
jgi:hypothetical protein